MGLFDRLFGRKSEPKADANGSAQSRQRAAPSNPREALEPTLALLGASSVRTEPDDPDECEVRGSISGRPARVKLDERPWLSLEFRAEIGLRIIVLTHNPSKIPKQSDADDPWDDDEVRTFVAKGVYAEGSADNVNKYISHFAALSDTARTQLVEAISTHFAAEIPTIFVAAGDSVSLAGHLDLAEVEAVAAAVLPTLATIVDEIEQLPDPMAAMTQTAAVASGKAASQPAATQRKCAYCRSRYVATWDLNCPNCGAPPR